MKILLTGGGTGGHFYPIIAVVEAIYELVEEERLLEPKLILAADKKYDQELIERENLIFRKISTGKFRRYASIFNLIDIFKTFLGSIKAIGLVYSDMPDAIFGKGGYASFPALLAARIFKIPVIIHESDSIPGKVNKWAGKFAQRVAISFSETAKYFPKEKTALTGTPVRKNIISYGKPENGGIWELEKNIPTILILGGSQGAQKINDIILDISDELIKFSQIIHQCGKKNEKEVKGRANIILEKSSFKNRYHIQSYLSDADLRSVSAEADLVISRAGSSAIFEIASWGLPSIMMPIKNSAQNHQRENAYSYARSGATEVIEEDNLSPHVLLSEIQQILSNEKKMTTMREAAKKFAKPDAARKIAKEIINLALEHAQ